MDPNLHTRQGVNLLNRIITYYPYVREGDRATVALTREDWHVVADLLFHMGDPSEILPNEIESFRLSDDQRSIELQTEDCHVTVEMS